MPSTWAPNDWLSSDPVNHTNLNKIGDSIRTWGGVGSGAAAPGTVTINANQNALSNLGNVTFASSKYIGQDAWTNLTMSTGFTSGSGGLGPALRVRRDKEGYVVIEGYVVRSSGAATDGTTFATGLPATMQPSVPKVVGAFVMDGTGAGSFSPGVAITGSSLLIYGVRTGYTQFHIQGRYYPD